MKLFIMAILICPCVVVFGQSSDNTALKNEVSSTVSHSGLVLYASLGFRQLDFQSSFHSQADNPSMAPSLGAGSYWSKNRLMIGTEFYYSDKQKETTSNKTHSHTFNSNVFFGYKVVRNNDWNVAPLIGLATLRNRLSVAGRNMMPTTAIYNQSTFGIHSALSIEKFTKKGFFMGLKLGYNIPFDKEKWVMDGPNTTTNLTDNPGGFFIQLTTGGLIKL